MIRVIGGNSWNIVAASGDSNLSRSSDELRSTVLPEDSVIALDATASTPQRETDNCGVPVALDIAVELDDSPWMKSRSR